MFDVVDLIYVYSASY